MEAAEEVEVQLERGSLLVRVAIEVEVQLGRKQYRGSSCSGGGGGSSSRGGKML